MDQLLWKTTLASVKRNARRIKAGKRFDYPHWLIVAMFLWAVWHDRPMCWACKRSSYGSLFRPGELPSNSQLSRRIRSQAARELLQMVHEDLAGPVTATALSYLDGKPLPVGPASKDAQARKGHVYSGFARGYRLHAYITEDRRFPAWYVDSLNVGEVPVALELVQYLPRLSDRSLVVADGEFDAADLHKLIDAKGGRLLTPPRGYATHPVTLRQMGPARREALGAWADPGLPAGYVYRQRIHAEAAFSNLCSFGGGLGPLPAWVRTLDRVRRWVGAKIIIYHARLRARQALAHAPEAIAA